MSALVILFFGAANAANLAKTGLDFSYIKPRMITDADYFTFQELKKQFQV